MGQHQGECGILDLHHPGGPAAQGNRAAQGRDKEIAADVEKDLVGPLPQPLHQIFGVIGLPGCDAVGTVRGQQRLLLVHEAAGLLGHPQGVVARLLAAQALDAVLARRQVDKRPGVLHHQAGANRSGVGGLQNNREKLVQKGDIAGNDHHPVDRGDKLFLV